MVWILGFGFFGVEGAQTIYSIEFDPSESDDVIALNCRRTL